MDSPNQFWIRAILVFLSIIGIVILGRYLMLPDSWGQYGYYRGAYVDQEANKPLIHGTNQSCISCHNEVVELQNYHSHKNLSCETCHSSINTHIENGKKIADMDIKQGENQVNLCLKCHQKTVGRPENFPMIDRFEHLDKLKVKNTHTCDQCPTHARKFGDLNDPNSEVAKIFNSKNRLTVLKEPLGNEPQLYYLNLHDEVI